MNHNLDIQPDRSAPRRLRPRMVCAAAAALKELLPAGIATADLVGEGDPAQLLQGERDLLRRAAPIRARELAAGRICARRAAAQFGYGETAIGARSDRRPRWPPALTGSITHTRGVAVAAVGERHRFRAIGIDVERIGGVSTDMWRHLLLPVETERLQSLPVAQQARLATLMFSAKEAFYKCQFEVTGQWLEFKDVSVDFGDSTADRGRFAVQAVSRVELLEVDEGPLTGYFGVAGDLVVTAMIAVAR